MKNIDPYLSFPGTCREAMTFYQECFGGKLDFHRVADGPMAKEMPAEAQDKIFHARLETEQFVVMASDMICDEQADGSRVSLCVNCTSEEEIQRLFKRFSEGGKVTAPLEDAFWGATFGSVVDRFGTSWMFNFQKVPHGAS